MIQRAQAILRCEEERQIKVLLTPRFVTGSNVPALEWTSSRTLNMRAWRHCS